MNGRPRRESRSAARQSQSRSPAAAGITIGVAAISAASSSVASLRLKHEIGAGAVAAPELAGIGAVDADEEAQRLHRRDRVFQMREGRRRQAAEIDHLGAVGGKRPGARQDAIDRELRRVDDLGEDAHLMGVEIDRFAGAAEEGGQS